MRTMPDTFVYRVEYDGLGPYSSAPAFGSFHRRNAMDMIDSGDEAHPPPQLDPKLEPFFRPHETEYGDCTTLAKDILGDTFRHGFETFDALLDWFHSGSLDALVAAGFDVVEHRLPACAVFHGTYQSIFNPDETIESTVLVFAEEF